MRLIPVALILQLLKSVQKNLGLKDVTPLPTHLITISFFENICRLLCYQPLIFGGVLEDH